MLRIRRLLLLGLLFLSVLLSSAACDEFLFGERSILNSGISSREAEDFTKLVEAVIREINPAIEFADVTNDPSVALPGERDVSPEQPPEQRVVPPKQEPGGYRAISHVVQSSIPDTLSAQNPADIFNRGGKYKKFKIVPSEDLQSADQLLFPVKEYHFSLTPDLVELEKTKKICDTLKEHWEDQNNYEKLSNILSELRLELPFLKGGNIDFPANLDLLDDLLASYLIAHLIPGEMRVFVRGYADSCNSSVDCPIKELTRFRYDVASNSYYPDNTYYYDRIKVHHFINPNRNNPEAEGFQEVAVDKLTGNSDGFYWNRDLLHLRARFLWRSSCKKIWSDVPIPKSIERRLAFWKVVS